MHPFSAGPIPSKHHVLKTFDANLKYSDSLSESLFSLSNQWKSCIWLNNQRIHASSWEIDHNNIDHLDMTFIWHDNDKVWIWTLSHWCGKLKNRYLDSWRKISLKSCFVFLSSTEIYRLFRHCPESQQPPISSCNFWFKSPNLQIELFPAKIVHGSHLTNYMRLSIEENSVSTSKGRGSAPTCSLNDERMNDHPSFITHLLPSHGVKSSCRS